ncbi:MAG: ATPase, partial [Hydrogenoanaerobacterium sp.]
MRVAVLSGKGGTGKTFVAVNLAAAAGKAVYIDCDVEEPNGRLFFKPQSTVTKTVTTLVPQFDTTKCN